MFIWFMNIVGWFMNDVCLVFILDTLYFASWNINGSCCIIYSTFNTSTCNGQSYHIPVFPSPVGLWHRWLRGGRDLPWPVRGVMWGWVVCKSSCIRLASFSVFLCVFCVFVSSCFVKFLPEFEQVWRGNSARKALQVCLQVFDWFKHGSGWIGWV